MSEVFADMEDERRREEWWRAYNSGLERAAQICEAIGRELDNEWNQGLGKAKDLVETCEECAENIRSQRMPLP